MGKLVYGTTILLWPVLVSSHLTRFSSHPSPNFAASDSKQFETPPVPVRFAPDIPRGPSPPDPFEERPKPVELAVESVTDASGTRSRQNREDSPATGDVELLGLDEAALRKALKDAAENDLADASPEPSSQAASLVQRRLLLETPLPPARLEERIPSFELPIGSDGATLRLPLIPTTREAATSAPPSSATYRTE